MHKVLPGWPQHRRIERTPHPETKKLPTRLGAGQYGTVYHTQFQGQEVAVKMLIDMPNEEDARLRESILEEAEVLLRLRHHNIIIPRAVCTVRRLMLNENSQAPSRFGGQRLVGIVLEFAPLGSLRSVLNHRERNHQGPMSVARACRVMQGVYDGLAYLHSREPAVIHRDLKPENILLRKDGTSMLADFGLARRVALTMTPWRGTAAYMAPEQFGEHFNTAADIWATGIILFELLTGCWAFDGMSDTTVSLFSAILSPQIEHLVATKQKRPWDFDPLPDRNDQAFVELKKLMLHCLHSDPQRRPSAFDASRLVDAAVESTTLKPAPVDEEFASVYESVDAPLAEDDRSTIPTFGPSYPLSSSHPDPGDEVVWPVAPVSAPQCRFDGRCFRLNTLHWEEVKHTKQKAPMPRPITGLVVHEPVPQPPNYCVVM